MHKLAVVICGITLKPSGLDLTGGGGGGQLEGCKPANLPKNELLHPHFSRILASF